ncbi:MAG: hypothetical protein ACRBB0_16275 [Pelagimonas sp.]|uniref:hypothetical protein n=1 Tax=Pelagimonas sp. TaxID=2073170 RepID=UPI003D6B9083
MTLTWTSRPTAQVDPMGDWLAQSDGRAGSDAWRPRIIYTETSVAAKVNATDMQAFFAAQSDYRVTQHDLNHWMHCNLQSGTTGFDNGPNELIVFEHVKSDSDNDSFDLDQKMGAHLGVASPEHITVAAIGAAASGIATRAAPQATQAEQPVVIQSRYHEETKSDEGPLVVTAMIDHAIPFANSRFRQSLTESRVDAVWLQGRGGAHPSGDVVIGRALFAADIDQLLTPSVAELGGDAAVYTQLANPAGGMWQAGDRPLAQSYCHGGMMLDIAAGRQLEDPKAARHRILAVELPPQLVAQTNGFMHEIYVKSAMNWVWDTASQLYADTPHEVLLNYSFGDHSGRHDGQGLLDADFQLRLDRSEFAAITVSAGNAFQADCHAELTGAEIAAGQELFLCLQPDDKTASFVQFWLEGDYDELPFVLSVTPPSTTGFTPPPAPLAGDGDLQDMDDPTEALARLYVQRDEPDYALPAGAVGRARTRVTLALRPTASDDPKARVAPAGRWTLAFGPKSDVALDAQERVMLWVERGDSLAGFPPRGRQAYLDHRNHQRRLGNGRLDEALSVTGDPIKRRNTISSNACARDVLVVSATRASGSGAFAAYSSAGAGTNPAGDEPSGPVAGVAIELSDARRSMLASGTGSGTVRLANGTSAAAASLSRRLADAILDGEVAVGTNTITQDLRAHVLTLANADPRRDTARGGAGRIANTDRREQMRRRS